MGVRLADIHLSQTLRKAGTLCTGYDLYSRASYCRSQAILAVVGKEGDEVYIKPEERKDNAVQKITSTKKDVLHGEP
ncbi:hypothetical protein ACFX1Z_012823 [Malus domestica]